MSAEFIVHICHKIVGLGVVVHGKLNSGEIYEGQVGRVSSGKKCSIVKIVNDDMQVPKIDAEHSGDMRIVLKHIDKSDVILRDFVYFD